MRLPTTREPRSRATAFFACFGFTAKLFAVTTSLVLVAASCVPASNPFDPDTPADLQAKATVRGRAAFPIVDGYLRPPAGIVVALESTEDPTTRFVITTDQETQGGFTFRDVTPGAYVLLATANGYIAQSNELILRAGEERDVGVIELGLSTDTAAVSGTIIIAEDFASNALVALVRANADGTCPAGADAPPAFVSTANAAGGFEFPAIPEGTYQAWVLDPAYTPSSSETFTVVANNDVAVNPITVQNSSALLRAVGGEGAGITAVNTREVELSLVDFGDMEQMRFFEDNVGNATTDWTNFAESFTYSIEGAEGERTVFLRLRNSCITTPHYPTPILFDQTPPLFLSSTIFGREGVSQPMPSSVVLGNTNDSIPVQSRAFDVSGVAGVDFIVNGVPQNRVAVGPTAPFQAALVSAAAPLENGEGVSVVEVLLVDVAGNVTLSAAQGNQAPVIFRVIRDLSAPGTPIPTAEELTVTSPTTLLWLDERECPQGQDNSPFVCEANPPEPIFIDSPIDGIPSREVSPLFLIRGGPDYSDFTPVIGPPFHVRVFVSGNTLFEIQAQDDAGNLSPGVARVLVTREEERTLFTAPPSVVLGTSRSPDFQFGVTEPFPPTGRADGASDLPLVASGGTALFALSPRPGLAQDTYYSYLIAQSVTQPPLGLDRAVATFPAGIRKLSTSVNNANQTSTFARNLYRRNLASVGVLSGSLAWLESNPSDYFNLAVESPRPDFMVASPNSDGNYAIDSLYEIYRTDDELVDADGEPAQGIEPNFFGGTLFFGSGGFLSDCAVRGDVRCSKINAAWGGNNERGPTEFTSFGDRVFFNGAGIDRLPLGTPQATTVDVTGPVLVMTRTSQTDVDALERFAIRTLNIDIGVPPGTQLKATTYEQADDGSFRPDNGNDNFLPIHVAVGAAPGETTTERILVANEAQLSPRTREVDINGNDVDIPVEHLIGVLIPDGVTATVRLAGLRSTGAHRTTGSVFRPVDATDLENNGLPDLLETDATDRADVGIALSLDVVPDGADSSRFRRGGLSVWNLGDDAFPTVGPVTADLLEDGITELESYAQESQEALTVADPASEPIPFGDPATSVTQVPDSACMVVFRPDEDLEVDSIRIRGNGLLDDSELRGFVWRSATDTAFGNFELDTTFRHGFAFTASGPEVDAQGVNACVDVVQEPQVITDENGTIAPPVVRLDNTIPGTVQDVIFTASAQETVANTFQHVHDVASPIQVVPGQVVSVVMSDNAGTGDADLYLRFGAEATTVDYDCRPFRNGSFEPCSGYVVPDGVTDLFIAFDTFIAPVDVNFVVIMREPDTDPVGEEAVIPVSPGELLTVRSVNTSPGFAVHDVSLRWDDTPTSEVFDCDGVTNFEESTCRVLVPEGVSAAHVGVRPDVFTGSETWDLEIEVIEAGSVQVVSELVLAADAPFVLRRTGGGDASILIRRSGVDETVNNLLRDVQCDTTNNNLNNNTDCNCEIDAPTGDIECTGRGGGFGVPERHTFYVVGQPVAGGDFNVTLDVPRTGCSESTGVASTGLFEAGNVYALTIGRGGFVFSDNAYAPETTWVNPDANGNQPAVNFITGAPNDDIGFIGRVTDAAINNGELIVTNLDAAAPRCDVIFDAPRRTEFHHIAASSASLFAARTRFVPGADGSLVAETALMRFDADAPVSENGEGEVLEVLSPGTRVLDTTWLLGEPEAPGATPPAFLAWIESDAADLVRVNVKRVDVPSERCEVAIVNPLEDFLDVSLARFNESIRERMVIAGSARVRPEARLFVLDVAPGCQTTLTEKGRRRLAERPVAAAYEGGDLFFWDQPDDDDSATTGGSLRHFDLREPTIIHPGGRLSVTGFDVDGGDIAAALSPEVGRSGALNEVVEGQLVRHLLSNDTGEETLFFHPQYVGSAGLAAMGVRYDPDTGSAVSNLWLFARGNEETPPIELASAAVYLVPATITADPLENARSPVLRSDGDLLALLGFQNGTDNRALTVYRLPTGLEGSASPVGTVVSVAADVSQVYVTGDLITLVFQNGNARVFQVGNGLTEIDVDTFDEDGTSLFIRQERIIGATDGNLLVLKNPGNLFDVSAPRFLDVDIRPIEAYTEDAAGPWPTIRLPAGATIHAFPTIATDNGEYLLYDDRASPPVMWHAIVGGKDGTPDDGPSRPLTGGTERIGVSAMPKVDGGNVYYVRGAENGGRALMRYSRR